MDPYAKVFVGASDTFFTRVNLIGAAVPEPATLALVGLALAGLGYSQRRKLNGLLAPMQALRDWTLGDYVVAVVALEVLLAVTI